MLKHFKELSQKARASLKYGLAAIILAVPLYPKFPFITLPGTAVSIRLEDFLVFVVFILLVISIAPEIVKIAKSKIARAFILFWLITLSSVLAGIFLTQTILVPYVGMLHWVRRIQYMSLFFIAFYSVTKKEDFYFYLKLFLIVVLGAFWYGVGQRYFNLPIITTQNQEYARGIALRWRPGAHLVSTFAGHYDLASYLILTLPMFYLLWTSKKELLKKFVPGTNARITRWMIIIITLMGVWLLAQSASRISLVSYLGSSILGLLILGRKKFIPIVLVISIFFAATSMNLIDRYIRIIDVTVHDVEQSSIIPSFVAYAQEATPTPAPTPAPIEDRSTSIRLNVEWPRAVRALMKNPLTGTGYSSITLATDNDYLRMFGETGLLGFAAFFLVLGIIVLELIKKLPSPNTQKPEDMLLVGVFAAIPGIMLNMVFIDILEASKFAISFWLLLGLAVAVIKDKLYE